MMHDFGVGFIGGLIGFIGGCCFALKYVGYGVKGGIAQIIRLWSYTHGRCQCRLCRPDAGPYTTQS